MPRPADVAWRQRAPRCRPLLVLLALFSLLTGLQAAAQTQAAPVSSLELLNADTGERIYILPRNTAATAANGFTLNLRALPTRRLTIAARIAQYDSFTPVGSVRFGYDGNPNYKLENVAPYVLAGDNGTDSNGRTSYNSWTPTVGTHTVTATAFSQRGGGGTAGAPFSVTFTVVDEPLRAADLPGSAPNTAPGVNYAYYEGTNWSALPDFAALTPVRTGTVTGTAEAFTLAPRLRDDDFAFRYTGYLFIGVSGEYTFYTTSDDGSQLFIGSQLVVNNDGLHGAQERSGSIMLSAGYHAFTTTYFERNGGQELRVAYADALEAAQNNPRLRRALNVSYLTPALAPTPAPVLAINVGGGAVGRFQADQFFGGLEGAPAGTPSTTSFNFDVALNGFDLAPEAVYKSQREGTGTGYFVYSVRSGLVEGQTYRLRLHFAEQSFAAAGERQFNVVLNGTTTLLANFDIAATVGDFRAVVREFTFTARPASSSTGNLFLRFEPGAAGKPIVNGIEILPLPAPAPAARQALANARAAGAEETVLLYPNPAREQLTVRLQAGADEDVRVEVRDALARRVAGTSLRTAAGWNDVRLPLGALPGGVYSVTVQRGAVRTVRRLVVAP